VGLLDRGQARLVPEPPGPMRPSPRSRRTGSGRTTLASDASQPKMVSPDAYFVFVTEHVEWLNERIIATYNSFWRLYSAIVGGSIWLSLQPGLFAAKSHVYAVISTITVVGLALVSCSLIVENVRSWRGYRLTLHELSLDEVGAHRMPKPHTLRRSASEVVMMLAMVVAAGLFGWFNPFWP
jgi:hypothetical protein